MKDRNGKELQVGDVCVLKSRYEMYSDYNGELFVVESKSLWPKDVEHARCSYYNSFFEDVLIAPFPTKYLEIIGSVRDE